VETAETPKKGYNVSGEFHALTFIQCIFCPGDRICRPCRERGLTNCEPLNPLKYRSDRTLSKSQVFNDIAEGLNLAHQRSEWIRISPSSATTLNDMLEIVNQQSPGQEDNINQDEIRALAEHPKAIVSMDIVEGLNPTHQGLGWAEAGIADPLAILEQMLLDPTLASSSNPDEDDSTDLMDLKKFVEGAVSIVCNQFSDVDIEYIRSLVQEEVLERRAEIFAIEEAERQLAREQNLIPRFSSLDPPSTYTPDSRQRPETIPDAHSTRTNSEIVDLQSMEWASSVLEFEDVQF